MIGRLHRNRSLFYAAFDREADLIKDDHLDNIDAILDDEQLIELVTLALARRSPRSRTRGREGIAPDRVLRACVLKHLKGWSFRELERELRGSLVYRRFTRFDSDPIPDFTNFCRAFSALGDDFTRQLHTRIVVCAIHDGIAPGRKIRTDTTVTESNVHYPTDSNLLADGIRVLTRSLARVSEQCAEGAVKVVDHARAAKHRVLEITRAAKSFTDAAREQVKSSYSKLLGLARSVMHKAEEVTSRLKDGTLPVVGKAMRVVVESAKLEHFLPLVRSVIAQTKARVFQGDTHFKGKLVSIFEEHTQVICKGKAHKPTEFGRLVRVDEVENGIVSNYEVTQGNPPDQERWEPALSEHKKIFGHAPTMATADRGYSSAANERAAKDLGVKKVVLPARGRLSVARKKLQGQRWYKRTMKWRAGIEARIAALKHCFDMDRAHYKGDLGFKRYVGWSIIANNLTRIARTRAQRKVQSNAQRPSAPPEREKRAS
jgi:transposase, IS5 family